MNFALNDISVAATNVKNFINTNKKLPNYVTIGNIEVLMPDFMYLLVTGVLEINKNMMLTIVGKTVGAADISTSNFTIGANLQKIEYLNVAQSIQSFINSNSRAPNYATTSIGTLSFNDLLYNFSLILDFYNLNKRLPEYLTAEEVPEMPVIEKPTAQEGSDLWVKEYVEWKIQKTISSKEDLNAAAKNMTYADYLNFKHTKIEAVTIYVWDGGINCAEFSEYIAKPILNVLGFKIGIDYWIVHGYVTCKDGKKYGHYWIVFSDEFKLLVVMVPENNEFLDLAGVAEMGRAQGTLICNEGDCYIDRYMTDIPSTLSIKNSGDDTVKFKLGKKPFVENEKDLKLRKYLTSELPPLPATFGMDRINAITDWGMLGNDTLGDCVIAGGMHETMLWSLDGGKPATFTDDDAVAAYSAACGYDPNDPNSDQGCDVRTVLNYRQKTGFTDANGNIHKIGAFLGLDITKLEEIQYAIYLFDAAGIGIKFPDSAMDQFNAGQPWTVVENSPVDGEHYVCSVIAYDGTYFYVVTWGKIQKVTPEFLLTYLTESWAILDDELINGSGESPTGFNLAQLKADLQEITTDPVDPPVDPTPNPDLEQAITCINTAVAAFNQGSQCINVGLAAINQAITIIQQVESAPKNEDVEDKVKDALEKIKEIAESI